MEHQLGVSVNVALYAPDLRSVAARLIDLADEIEGGKAVKREAVKVNEAVVDAAQEKKTRKPRTTKPVEAAPIDLGFAEETQAVEEATTLEDIVDAFRVYVRTNPREAAAKILGKFGVKSVQDLKPEHFSDVLCLLRG